MNLVNKIVYTDYHKNKRKHKKNLVIFHYLVNQLNFIKIKGFFYLIVILVFSSCFQKKQEKDTIKKAFSIENINKELVEKDKEAILSYINRKQWNMQVTKTGLWYMIYRKGNGIQATAGKQAVISYQVSLLDGTICYQSDSVSPKIFTIGQGGIESGLEEGILLLHKGDKAKFIMPPHLAYGLIGDENKIPGRATIVYDIEVLDICN